LLRASVYYPKHSVCWKTTVQTYNKMQEQNIGVPSSTEVTALRNRYNVVNERGILSNFTPTYN
jgi:hypothetical protein